jgi:type I restriction enzyme M protein
MPKSLGDKRREIPLDRAQDIVKILVDFKDGDTRRVADDGQDQEVAVSHIFPNDHFGFRKITVERPLKLNFHASPERIARLEEEKSFLALEQSKKKGLTRAKEQEQGRTVQDSIRAMLGALPDSLCNDRKEFERILGNATQNARVKLSAPILKAILSALSEPDPAAAICSDKEGNPEPDPELRDTENVPLSETIENFFAREVKPHVTDAWIDTAKRDHKDGQVGIVGYEINFNRYFYKYAPPRPLKEIDADIRTIEKDIIRGLAEVTRTVSYPK